MSESSLPAASNVPNIMSYGSPAAKAEVIVKLIYIGNVEVLQRIYDSITDKELNRIVGFA